MGTRNVTIIKLNNEPVVVKYTQWDGYPTGTGLALCDFIKNNMDLRVLKSKVKKCYPISEEKADEIFYDYVQKREKLEKTMREVGLDRSFNGVYYEAGRELQRNLVPTLTRDTNGADVLLAIQKSEGGLPLCGNEGNLKYATGENDFSFGCEYCYEVDLDSKVLSVYDGLYKGLPIATYKFSKLKKVEDLRKLMEDLEKAIEVKYAS